LNTMDYLKKCIFVLKHYIIMKTVLGFILAFALYPIRILAQDTQSAWVDMIIGTYTEGGNSEGIYTYHFNQNTGLTDSRSDSIRASNPTFVAQSSNDRMIYAVCEYHDGRQGLYAFERNTTNGKLKEVNWRTTIDLANVSPSDDGIIYSGGDPCNVFVTPQFVATANYTGGDISVFPIDSVTGGLKLQSQHHKLGGDTTVLAPHAHCLLPSPDGKYAFVTDLGNSCIYRYDLHAKSLNNPVLAWEGENGMGPRHFIFDKEGNHAYLINELGGQLVVFDYHDGTLLQTQIVMADENGGHGSADIHITPDGKFLYTSHRLKGDGIAIFRIDQESGKVSKVGYEPTGRHPRNFGITPNGRFLLVACRDDNKIQVFSINSKTGKLTDTGHTIYVSKPSCIAIIK